MQQQTILNGMANSAMSNFRISSMFSFVLALIFLSGLTSLHAQSPVIDNPLVRSKSSVENLTDKRAGLPTESQVPIVSAITGGSGVGVSALSTGGTIVTSPPLIDNNGSGGVTFAFEASSPVEITGISAIFDPGVTAANVYVRRGGVTSGGNPIIAGYTLEISAGTVTNANGTVNAIDFGGSKISVSAGERIGVYIETIGGSLGYQSGVSTDPVLFSDGTATVSVEDSVAYGGPPPTPSFNPRRFLGSVTYQLAVTGNCTQFTGLSTTNITGTSAQVNWTPGSGNASYKFEYGPAGFTPGSGTVLTGTYPGSQPMVMLSGLSPQTTYEYYLEEYCNSNNDTVGTPAPVSFTTTKLCAPPASFAAANITSNSADLSWTHPGGANDYRLIYGPVGFDPMSAGTVITVTGLTHTLSGLSPTTGYDVYLAAYCGVTNGYSDTLGPVNFNTLIAGPQPLNCTTGNPSVVFSEEFDSPTGWTGDIGTGSSSQQWNFRSGGTTSGSTGPSGAHSGSNYAFFEASGTPSTTTKSLVSPLIDLSAGTGDAELSFWMHAYGVAMGTLTVGVGTSAAGPFTPVFTFSGQLQTANADPWQNVGADLTPYLGQSIYLEFSFLTGNAFTSDMAIDLVEVSTCLSCAIPSNLTNPNLTSTSVDAAWTENGTATQWELSLGTPGFTPGSGFQQITGNNPYSASGLTPNTTYQWYVRSICGPGDTSGWSSPATFTTLCAPISAPYSQDFESGFNPGDAGPAINSCFNSTNTADSQWEVEDATGSNENSTGTGPFYDKTNFGTPGGHYLYLETTGTTNLSDTLTTDQIDVSGLTNPYFGFSYHMYGAAMGTLEVEVWDGAAWVNIFSVSGQQQTAGGDPWIDFATSLPALSSNIIQFRFIGIRGTSFTSDMAIDDVFVVEAPSCAPSTGLMSSNLTSNSVDIMWVPGGGSSFNLEYGPTGFTPGSGTTVVAPGSPFSLSGLMAFTGYDVYLEDDCGANGLSGPVGPISFTTLANAVSLPYSEDFENGDGNWLADNSTSGTWEHGMPSNTIINQAASGSNAWVTDLDGPYNNNELSSVTSPPVDISSATGKEVFRANIWWNSEFSWDGAQLLYSVDGGTTWTVLGAVGDPSNWYNDGSIGGLPAGQQMGWTGRNSSGNGSGGWVSAKHELDSAVLVNNSLIIFRVLFGADGSANDEGFAFDDVFVGVEACPEPSGLANANVTTSSADASWTENGTATQWQLSLGTPGFTAGQGFKVVTGNNPYSASGLMPNTTYQWYVRAICGPGDTSAWSTPATFTTLCAPVMAPYFQDFESGFNPGAAGPGINTCFNSVNAAASRWEVEDATGSNENSTGTGPHFDNTNFGVAGGHYLYLECTGTTNLSDTLTSDEIDVSGLTAPFLSFYYHMYGADMGTLEVEVWDGSAWVNVFSVSGQQQSDGADAWIEFGAPLPTLSSNVTRIRFIGIRGTDFTSDMAIDDISIIETPACPSSTGLTASNVSDVSAQLSWTAGGGTSFNVEYGPVGFTPGTGTTVSGVPNPYTLVGLTPGTAYDVYIIDDCGSGSLSAPSGPVSFTTAQCPLANTCDYIADLKDDFGDGWNGGQVTIYQNGAPVKVLGTTFNSGSAQQDTAALCDMLMTYVVLTSAGNYPEEIGLDITNPFGVLVGSYPFNGGAGTGDTLFSFMSNCTPPQCPQPTNLSNANLTSTSVDAIWTENGTATQWELSLGAPGFTAGQGTEVVVGSNPVNVPGLMSNTTYEWYVRAICGPGDTSNWSGPLSFTTLCAPFTAPFIESFDGSSTPSCWSQSATNGGPWEFSTGVNSVNCPGAPDHTGNGGNYAWMDHSGTTADVGVILETPDIDVSALTQPYLEFYYWMCGVGYTPPNITVIEAWNGTSWVIWDSLFNATSGWEKISGDILPSQTYGNGLVRLRFRAESGGSTDDYYGDNAIDDIMVMEAPSCVSSTNLMVSNVSDVSAQLAWTAGSGTNFNVEYGPVGFTPGSGTTISGVPNPYTLVGLTPGTSYDVYIIDDCGTSGTSLPAGPVSFTTSPCPLATTCDFVADLEDDFGDGWNGAEVTVYQAGVPVATLGSNFNSGSSQQDTVPLCDNLMTYVVLSTPGAYSYEVGISFTNPLGAVLATYSPVSPPGPGQGDTLLMFNSSCTLCPTDSVYQQATICDDDSLWAGGSWQNMPGIYVDSLVNQIGCDSLVYTDLMVNPTYDIMTSASICDGDSMMINGNYETMAGMYSMTFTSVDGCDSTYTVDLMVNPTFDIMTSAAICDGDSMMINGNYETMAGMYSMTFTSVDGCDSTYTVDLMVNPTYDIMTTAAICDGDSIMINGFYETMSGVYSMTFASVDGCDSTYTVDLTANPTYDIMTSASICDGDSMMINGFYETMSGVYSMTFASVDGCDSSYTVDLTVLPAPSVTVNDSICPGDSLFVGGAWQTTAGNYVDIYMTANGCDSTVTTVLVLDSAGCVYDCNGDLNGTAYIDGCGTCVGGNTGLQPCVPGCNPNEIVTLNLIDASNATVVKALVDGDTIDKSVLTMFSIEADTCGFVFGSVQFDVNGVPFTRENLWPYAIKGGNATSYNAWNPVVGTYLITATPYTMANATGMMGTGKSVTVHITDTMPTLDCNGDLGGTAFIDSCGVCVGGNTGKTACVTGCATLEVVSFDLVSSMTGMAMNPLNDGDTIYLGSIGSFTIRANTCNGAVGSVIFDLNGSQFKKENLFPYDIMGGSFSSPIAFMPPVGTHTVVATPYANKNGKGMMGIAETVTFHVVAGMAPRSTNGSINNPYDQVDGQVALDGSSIDAESMAGMRVFPNPTEGLATISLINVKSDQDVIVLDASGKIIAQLQPASLHNDQQVYDLDLSNAPRGMYLIQVNTGDQILSKRLIVK